MAKRKPKPPPKTAHDEARRKALERAGERNVEYGAPEDYDRRLRLESDPPAWLKWYLPEAFPVEWAPFHLDAIGRMWAAILQSGLRAVGLPRGSGKTAICKGLGLLALLSGRKRYLLLVGATGAKGAAMLRDIKTWLRFSDRLCADYPEICEPIRALEGVSLRARAQTGPDEDIPTMIEWQKARLVFPSCPRITVGGERVTAASCGSVIDCDGITGDIRGHSMALKTGEIIRPDLCIPDDPSTRESAKSKEQNDDRERTIKADIAASAGIARPMTVIVPCTVIYRGDLADRLTDPARSPEWKPVKYSMLVSWPKDMDFWETEYRAAWLAGVKAEDSGASARRFYAEHKARLTDGAVVSWPQRFDAMEADGIQHAMNLYFKLGRESFASECQLEPIDEVATVFELPRDVVSARVNGLARREAPETCVSVVGMVDINHDGLRWALAGTTNSRNLSILDYGIYPGGGVPLFDPENPPESESVAIIRGLDGLARVLETVVIMRAGERMEIEQMLVDGSGRWMQAVFDWIAKYKGTIKWTPSVGRAAKNYRVTGTRVGRPGDQWFRARWPGKGRVIVFDADYWRMRQQQGWLVPAAAPDAITFFGKAGDRHDVWADGIVAERLTQYADTATGPMYTWRIDVGARNDPGDVTTGLYLAAAVVGAAPTNETAGGQTQSEKQETKEPGTTEAPIARPKPISGFGNKTRPRVRVGRGQW